LTNFSHHNSTLFQEDGCWDAGFIDLGDGVGYGAVSLVAHYKGSESAGSIVRRNDQRHPGASRSEEREGDDPPEVGLAFRVVMERVSQ